MELFDRRLILVLGKGGVGRTTVAAAIAMACAKRGKRTLLYQTNANDRLGPYYGKPPVGHAAVELTQNLYAINTTPAEAIAEYGLMILKFQTVYDMVFENRVTKAFIRAIPGLDDYALLGKMWFHTTESKRGKPVWDTVVFDMPASGHSVSMLRIPTVITETVPEGPLTRDAKSVKDLLGDKARTAAIIVTLAEEMPVNEACELEDKLAALGIGTQQMIVNQVYPDHFAPGAPVTKVLDALVAQSPQELGSPLVEVAAHASLSRDRRALNARYLEEVARRAKAPISQLPMVFAPTLGPEQIAQLSTLLPK